MNNETCECGYGRIYHGATQIPCKKFVPKKQSEEVCERKAWIIGNIISYEKPYYKSPFFDTEEVIVKTSKPKKQGEENQDWRCIAICSEPIILRNHSEGIEVNPRCLNGKRFGDYCGIHHKKYQKECSAQNTTNPNDSANLKGDLTAQNHSPQTKQATRDDGENRFSNDKTVDTQSPDSSNGRDVSSNEGSDTLSSIHRDAYSPQGKEDSHVSAFGEPADTQSPELEDAHGSYSGAVDPSVRDAQSQPKKTGGNC